MNKKTRTKMPKWYLAAMNDGLFIIDKPPRPSTDDQDFEAPGGPEMVLNVAALTQDRAERIVEQHNKEVEDAGFEAVQSLAELVDQHRTVMNPMGFADKTARPVSNLAAAESVKYFMAYGFYCCWPGDREDDPNSGCQYVRPVALDDVEQLRTVFLGCVCRAVIGFWMGAYRPDSGVVSISSNGVFLKDPSGIKLHNCWEVNVYFGPDDIEFVFTGLTRLPIQIHLGYLALLNRPRVKDELYEAARYVKQIPDQVKEVAKYAGDL
ncbi:MAG: hypothetical protein B7Z52_00375, partial [Burkholderiales bacterium 12-64-5]